MVGPQQTTGLIGRKWKTGNGSELTGTNRPTQTTTPTTTTILNRASGTVRVRWGAGTNASVHYTVHNQPNHTQVGRPHNTTKSVPSDSRTTRTIVSVVTATGITPGTHPEPGS